MPDDRTKPARLERNLGWIALLLLLIGCLLVLRPFASALLWSVVLCFSSWGPVKFIPETGEPKARAWLAG